MTEPFDIAWDHGWFRLSSVMLDSRPASQHLQHFLSRFGLPGVCAATSPLLFHSLTKHGTLRKRPDCSEEISKKRDPKPFGSEAFSDALWYCNPVTDVDGESTTILRPRWSRYLAIAGQRARCFCSSCGVHLLLGTCWASNRGMILEVPSCDDLDQTSAYQIEWTSVRKGVLPGFTRLRFRNQPLTITEH